MYEGAKVLLTSHARRIGKVTLSKMLMPLYSLTARSGVMLHHRTAVVTGYNVDWFSSHGFLSPQLT
jgi:hypothetical protein